MDGWSGKDHQILRRHWQLPTESGVRRGCVGLLFFKMWLEKLFSACYIVFKALTNMLHLCSAMQHPCKTVRCHATPHNTMHHHRVDGLKVWLLDTFISLYFKVSSRFSTTPSVEQVNKLIATQQERLFDFFNLNFLLYFVCSY